jgi:hypothetical protein
VGSTCSSGVCSGATGGGAGGGSGGGGGGSDGGSGLRQFRVFTPSSTLVPSFGGVAKGDGVCNVTAADAGLPGTYLAWLSSNAPDAGALARFPALPNTEWVMYRNDAGPAVVFASRAALTGVPSVAIDHDERGVTLLPGNAWTGTDGGGASSGATCTDWASISATGTYGDIKVAAQWTSTGSGVTALCTIQKHLYCFQVSP